MKQHEIWADGHELNMAGWTSEKAENVVKGLARLIDLIRAPGVVGLGDATNALRLAKIMLWDATKLWAFGQGAAWNVNDAQLIFETGIKGYEKLSREYFKSAMGAR